MHDSWSDHTGRRLGAEMRTMATPEDVHARVSYPVLEVTRAGLEPATYGLKVRCSTN